MMIQTSESSDTRDWFTGQNVSIQVPRRHPSQKKMNQKKSQFTIPAMKSQKPDASQYAPRVIPTNQTHPTLKLNDVA